MNQDTLQRPTPPVDPLQPASSPLGSAAAGIGEIKETAGNQAGQVAADVKDSAGDAFRSAKTAGTDFVMQQKEKLAARIDEYTDAVRAATRRLESDRTNPLASPANKAGEQLQRVAEYVRNKDPKDFVNDLGDLARRKPEVFFGSLFVAGLAAARFLKASAPDGKRYRKGTYDGIYQSTAISNAADHLPRPEPAPESAPMGPAPALETSNPAFIP